MAKVKRRKKKKDDINAPDEFQETMAKMAPFIERHGVKLITGFVILLIVVAGIYIGVRLIKQSNIKKLSALEAKADIVLRNWNNPDDKVKSAISSLEKNNSDKLATILIEAAGYRGLKKWDKAVDKYRLALSKAQKDDPLIPYIQQSLIECLINKGDLENAKSFINSLQGSEDPLFAAVGKEYEGDLYNGKLLSKPLSNSPKQAQKLYVNALQNFHKLARSSGDLAALHGNLTGLRLIDLGDVN